MRFTSLRRTLSVREWSFTISKIKRASNEERTPKCFSFSGVYAEALHCNSGKSYYHILPLNTLVIQREYAF